MIARTPRRGYSVCDRRTKCPRSNRGSGYFYDGVLGLDLASPRFAR